MSKLFYPAIFHKAEEGGFWITFPDIPECMTEGDDLSQAYEMAVEALGLSLTSMEQEHLSLPCASTPDAIKLPSDAFLVVIEFDMVAYKKKHCSRAIKKTLSIPEWLNDAALEMNINFSQVLQEALIQKISLSRNL